MNSPLSSLLNRENSLFKETKKLIQKVYLADDRPWVVGYSGGKDSTTVVQLVFESLRDLPKEKLRKKVYIISSDTLVENPLIVRSINTTLRRIQEHALNIGLPFETHKVKPVPEKSFWANIIGKGYPSPNQRFRWCTDRLKIEPANRFIMDKVSSFGEVIMVLGVRENESSTRDQIIRSHSIEGEVLMKHSTLPNSFVFAPIKNFSLHDVWDYLLSFESPWGDDNHALSKLYQDSNSSECPLVIDKNIKESAGSCGNSRFGCWVCTVVTQDRSLNGFIESGSEWLRPLLEFRNWLTNIRDDRSRRMKYRMNGQIYFNILKTIKDKDGKVTHVIISRKGSRSRQEREISEFDIYTESQLKEKVEKGEIDLEHSDDTDILIDLGNENYAQLGLGPFTMETRKEILQKLLQTQRDLTPPDGEKFDLITEEELRVIRRYWLDEGEWRDPLPKIFHDVMGYNLEWELDDRPLVSVDQLTDLEMLCQEYKVDFKVLKKLIALEVKFAGYKVRRGLHQEMEKILKQDYLHI